MHYVRKIYLPWIVTQEMTAEGVYSWTTFTSIGPDPVVLRRRDASGAAD